MCETVPEMWPIQRCRAVVAGQIVRTLQKLIIEIDELGTIAGTEYPGSWSLETQGASSHLGSVFLAHHEIDEAVVLLAGRNLNVWPFFHVIWTLFAVVEM